MTYWYWIKNWIGHLQNVTKISTGTFFIARHMWRICIYLLIIFIITVLGIFFRLTITPFIETDNISTFLLSLGGFGHLEIRWSTYPHLKHLQGGSSVIRLSESPDARHFPLSFIIFFLIFSAEWLVPSQKVHFSGQDFVYHCFYKNLNWCQDLSNQSVVMK